MLHQDEKDLVNNNSFEVSPAEKRKRRFTSIDEKVSVTSSSSEESFVSVQIKKK